MSSPYILSWSTLNNDSVVYHEWLCDENDLQNFVNDWIRIQWQI